MVLPLIKSPEGVDLVEVDITNREIVASLSHDQLVHLVALMARDLSRMGYGQCRGYMRQSLWEKEAGHG